MVERRNNKAASSIWHSALVLTAFAFVALNLVLCIPGVFRWDRYDFPQRVWSWWLMQDLRSTGGKSDNTAILGSSLVVAASSGCDANYLKRKIDLTRYHRCAYLDHALESRFGGKYKTLNLSAPGQMVSDAYLTLKAVVANVTKPQLVIYCLAPRDFIDTTVLCPADTDVFMYMTRLVPVGDAVGACFRGPLERFDWTLRQALFLYGRATDVQLILTRHAEKVLDTLIPAPRRSTPFTWLDRQRLLPKYKLAETHRERAVVEPIDRSAAQQRFYDNRGEYLERYQGPNKDNFSGQASFLERIATYCKGQGIKLVMVNMPLLDMNRALLPPGLYEKYLKALHTVARDFDVPLFDFGLSFQREDFQDPVHLNAFGGKRFFDELIAALAADARTATMVAEIGRSSTSPRAVAATTRVPNR